MERDSAGVRTIRGENRKDIAYATGFVHAQDRFFQMGPLRRRAAGGELRLRIKRWKAEQKCPSDTLSFDDSDKRWLAYLRAHVGNLELLPAINRLSISEYELIETCVVWKSKFFRGF